MSKSAHHRRLLAIFDQLAVRIRVDLPSSPHIKRDTNTRDIVFQLSPPCKHRKRINGAYIHALSQCESRVAPSHSEDHLFCHMRYLAYLPSRISKSLPVIKIPKPDNSDPDSCANKDVTAHGTARVIHATLSWLGLTDRRTSPSYKCVRVLVSADVGRCGVSMNTPL